MSPTPRGGVSLVLLTQTLQYAAVIAVQILDLALLAVRQSGGGIVAFCKLTGTQSVAASVRCCAKAWGWSDSKVRRFVARLQKLEMISVKTDAGCNVITIENYDAFQAGGAATDADPTQTRRKRE